MGGGGCECGGGREGGGDKGCGARVGKKGSLAQQECSDTGRGVLDDAGDGMCGADVFFKFH